MSTKFHIQSSDPELLEAATRVAHEFAQGSIREGVVGIVVLGAVARGYFDRSADIDIAFFNERASDLSSPAKFLEIDGFEVQVWCSDYEHELTVPWDMPKRWTYSQGQIYYDPLDKISRLLEEKVPLKPSERKWLMMSGLTLSEWYINRLTQTWVERGNLASAHHMFYQGLNFFFDMLFGLNDQLVPDMKWRYYCAEQLERLPPDFRERIEDTMILRSTSLEELDRRKNTFMAMWAEMKPVVEKEVGMTFDEMLRVV